MISIAANLPCELKAELNYTMYCLIDVLAEDGMELLPNGRVQFKRVTIRENILAERIGRSREWISKSLRKLEELGVIDVFRTRKSDGKFTVNEYQFTEVMYVLIMDAIQKVVALFKRISSHVKSSSQFISNSLSSIYSLSHKRKENYPKVEDSVFKSKDSPIVVRENHPKVENYGCKSSNSVPVIKKENHTGVENYPTNSREPTLSRGSYTDYTKALDYCINKLAGIFDMRKAIEPKRPY